MKKNIELVIVLIIGIVIGVTCFTFGSNYSSEEINYDNTISGAEAENVKDAIDWLYTNAGMKGECPEDMTCMESPIVSLTVDGPGSVNKNEIHVRINGSNKFKVTPDEGYVLKNISCDNGYTLSSFYTCPSSTQEECSNAQEILVYNPNIAIGATCNIEFGQFKYEINISSLYIGENSDNCNNSSEGCVCYYIKNNLSNFTYGSHTGCNFSNKICTGVDGSVKDQNYDCSNYLSWDNENKFWVYANGVYRSHTVCSGTILCDT